MNSKFSRSPKSSLMLFIHEESQIRWLAKTKLSFSFIVLLGKRFLFLTFIVFGIGSIPSLEANTFYLTSAGADSAQTARNWNTNAAGGGTAAGNFKTTGDIFIIPVGISGIVSANWTFGNGTIPSALTLTISGSLTIDSGVVLTLTEKNNVIAMTVNSGGSLIFLGTVASTNQIVGLITGLGASASNTITISSGAILKTANAGGIVSATNGSINSTYLTDTLSTGANYEFTGGAQVMTGIPSTINNLTLSGSGAKTLPGTVLNIGGNFTTSGTISTTALAAITIGGNMSIGSGTTFNAASYTHTVRGNWTNGGTFTGSTSTINFNGTGAQSIAASTFNNLRISNTGGTCTAGGNITVNSTFTTDAGTILNMAANTLSVSAVSHSGTLRTQNTSATPITSGKTWGGTVTFDGSSAQTIPTCIFNNITINVTVHP
jgi:hypothetical protein